MSYSIANETKDLGQFASNLGYGQLVDAAEGYSHLEDLIHDGWTEDVVDLVSDLRQLAADTEDEDVSSTASGLADLIDGEEIVVVHDGTTKEDPGEGHEDTGIDGAGKVQKTGKITKLVRSHKVERAQLGLKNVLTEFLRDAGKHVAAKIRQFGHSDKASKALAKYSYGSTQVDIDPLSDIGMAMAALRSQIEVADLAGKGLEPEAHVTVRYGIIDDEYDELRRYIRSLRPFTMTFGPLAAFPPTVNSDNAAVLILPVQCAELETINAELADHAHFKEASFVYRSHATIAYVRPESAAKYVGKDIGSGLSFVAASITICSKDDTQEVVPLEGTVSKAVKSFKKAAPASDVEEMLNRVLTINWSELPRRVTEYLQEIAQDTGSRALLQVRSHDSDIITDVNEAAADWAAERGAEMVGKKWVDGELVDNPDARWAISETTREDLRRIITDAFEGPMTIQELADEVEEAGAFSASRAEMIANTEGARAEVKGQLTGWRESGVVDRAQYLLSSDHPENSDCNCEDLAEENGGIYDLADAPEVPQHPNCLVGNVVVSASGVEAAMKRWFEGEIIVIRIAGAADISVTPNHPILTRRGWVAAGLLQINDEVLQCSDPAAAVRLVNPNNNYMETGIEQISDTLLMACGGSTATVPSSTEAFHGDGMANGEVGVIRSYGHLSRSPKAFESVLHACFTVSERNGVTFSGDGAEAEFLKWSHSTTDGSVRSISIPSSLLRSKPGMSKNTNLVAAANYKPGAPERSEQDGMAGSKPFGDGIRSISGHVCIVQEREVGAGESSDKGVMLSKTATRESGCHHDAAYDFTGDSDALGNVAERLSRLMRPVKLLDIFRRKFVGHVFNLQTDTGFYFANTIIVHNCWCALAPVLIGAEAPGSEDDE